MKQYKKIVQNNTILDAFLESEKTRHKIQIETKNGTTFLSYKHEEVARAVLDRVLFFKGL